MFQIDTLPPYAAPVDTASDSITAVCAYDTIFTPMGPVEPVLHRSLFTHHLLPVQTGHETTIQHQGSPGWLFVVIVLATTWWSFSNPPSTTGPWTVCCAMPT